MRWFSLSSVLAVALGVMGCSETTGTGGSAGDGGQGGAGGDSGATFSYSVITSNTGDEADLLEELRTSTLPTLEEAGAVVYALWGPSAEQYFLFPEISDDKIIVMLSWSQVDTELLTMELEALPNLSQVETSMWEAKLRGDEPPTEQGFYIHRFNRYEPEDVERVLSITEQAWATWEPYWEAEALGVWQDLQEEDGLAHHVRIAWYRDLQHWIDTRDDTEPEEPESARLFKERKSLQVDVLDNGDGWSASLLER